MQQQPAANASQQQLFRVLYGELVAETRATAREERTSVHTVVFLPDGGGALRLRPRAVLHDVRVLPSEGRARCVMLRLLKRDVSAMSAAQLARHAALLRALRAAVVRKLRTKEVEKKQATAAADGEGKVVKVKRELEEDQDEMLACCSKIGRVEF